MEVLSPWALGSRGHSGGGHWILHHCKTSRLSFGLRVDGIGRIYGRSKEINQAICLHAKIKMNLTCHVGKANNRATPNWSAIHGLKHYLNINRFTHNVKHRELQPTYFYPFVIFLNDDNNNKGRVPCPAHRSIRPLYHFETFFLISVHNICQIQLNFTIFVFQVNIKIL